jgi:hypothetical protein
VKGVVDVKNGIFVQDRPDPLLRAVADRLGGPRQPLVADLPAIFVSPQPVSVREQSSTPSAVAALVPPPLVAPEPAQLEVVVRRPPLLNATAPLSFLDLPQASTAMQPTVTLTASGTPSTTVSSTVFPARPNDVLASAETIRKADSRYTALTVEMKVGSLVIGGHAARAADAWDFAQSLRRVPGVERVVVGNVAVK